MKFKAIYVVLCLTMFSCAVVPKRDVAEPIVPEYFNTDSLRTIFYYTEGVKKTLLAETRDSAQYFFTKALEIDSLHAPSLFEIANLLHKNPEEAYKYSLKAYQIDTTNVDYQSQIAYMLMLNKEYAGAQQRYQKLLIEDPKNAFVYSMLAALYEVNGMPYSAISLLDSAEYKLGRIDELADYKRELLVKVKLYDRAIAETKTAIVNNPFSNDNYRVLAELYASTRKDSLAQASYQQALKLDSTHVKTLFSLANYYQVNGAEIDYLTTLGRIFELDKVDLKIKEQLFKEATSNTNFYARNYFRISRLTSTLLVKYPSAFSVLDIFAWHLIRSGETDQAAILYKSYISSNSEPEIEAFHTLVEIETFLQRPDSVAKYTDIALSVYPKNSDLYIRKGYALKELYKKEDDNTAKSRNLSIKCFKQALKYASTDEQKSTIWGIFGDVYSEFGNIQKSFNCYKKALRYNPENHVVLNNYAYFMSILRPSKNLEKYLEMSEKACELSPSNPTYLDTQAWILHLLGRDKEAKRIMQQAVSLDSTGDATLFFHYGEILYALDEPFLAKIYWRKALEAGYDADVIEDRIKQTLK